MPFHRIRRFPAASIRDRMIGQHSRWLSRILRRRRLPDRIPVRKVADGGFADLMATEAGRREASRWWESRLQRPD